MKKLLIILGVVIPLFYGCSSYDLSAEQPIDDFNSIPEEIKDQDSLSPAMKESLYAITSNTDSYAIYAKSVFQSRKGSWNKDEIIRQLNDFKYNIENASTIGTTNIDKEFEAVLYNYQYNAVKCIEYAISYVNTGDKNKLIMHNNYAQDLKENIQELNFLAEKHNIN